MKMDSPLTASKFKTAGENLTGDVRFFTQYEGSRMESSISLVVTEENISAFAGGRSCDSPGKSDLRRS
jgi:hypothetical protein